MCIVSITDFEHIKMTKMQQGTFVFAKIVVMIIIYKSNIYSLQQVN